MTVSASTLPREPEVQSRIQKIRTFSRSARAVCAFLFGIGIVGTVVSLLAAALMGIPEPQRAEGSAFGVLSSVLSPWQLRLWWVVSQGVVMGVGLAIVFQLYRLFGNLANGAIYTTENVRRVRRVGLLMLASALLSVVLPSITMAMATTFGNGTVPNSTSLFRSFGDSVNSLAAAGLVLLASWIMDVGLYEKEHADELRRDSDLMI